MIFFYVLAIVFAIISLFTNTLAPLVAGFIIAGIANIVERIVK